MKRLLIIGAFALILWGGEYLRRGLWEPDEARYAYIAKEMKTSGQWLVLHRHGELYPDKPPLMFWLINLFSIFTGGEINGISARLPSLLGAIFSLWVTVMLATRWHSEKAGWRAGLVLATSFLFWQEGGMGQLDSLLCGLEMMALYLLITNDDTPTLWRPALAYGFMGLAFLTKGPVGFVVPLGVYLTIKLVSGQRTALQKSHWIWGPLLMLAFPVGWLLAAWLAGGPQEYFEGLFGQTRRRVMEGTGHNGPFYYFLLQYPLELMPWTIFLPAAYAALRSRMEMSVTRRMLLGWLLFVLIFFSIPTDKRNLYVLLAYPPAAILIAIAWDDLVRLPQRWRIPTVSIALMLMFLLGIMGLVFSFWNRLPRDHCFSSIWDEEFPFAPSLLWPWSLIMGGGAIISCILYRRIGFSTPWLWTFGGILLIHQLYIANVIYPALNSLKTPWELAAAATTQLPPDQPLLIYRINGEILAFYADRSGQRIDNISDLKMAMGKQRRGIVVLGKKAWDGVLLELGAEHLEPHPFRMGNKNLVWVEFDVDQIDVRHPNGEKTLHEALPNR